MLTHPTKRLRIAWIVVFLMAFFAVGPVCEEALCEAPIEDATETERCAEESGAPAPARRPLAARPAHARPLGVGHADRGGPRPRHATPPASRPVAVPLLC
jgi:hypothetical protein